MAIILSIMSSSGTAAVTIERVGARWSFLKDGQPYEAKGVCVWGTDARLELLRDSGANSVRTYDPAHAQWTLDEAHRLGMTVVLGFDLGKPRRGFSYASAQETSAQRERFSRFIEAHRDHPALLAWSIGNEPELALDDPQEYDRLFTEINTLARLARSLDDRHPVSVTLAGFDQRKRDALRRHCPDLTWIGVNLYQELNNLTRTLDKLDWHGPVLVTEYGPDGTWEVEKTPWDAPVEPDSTTKAAQYLSAYRSAHADARVLGSYAFYWGNKQEATATWYGMLLPDGRRLPQADAMKLAWTGTPADRPCPSVTPIRTTDRPENKFPVFRAGETFTATIDVGEARGPLAYEWQVVAESSDRKLGGDFERAPAEVPKSVKPGHDPGEVTVTCPTTAGAYRLFVTVRDKTGGAATANLCLFVEGSR